VSRKVQIEFDDEQGDVIVAVLKSKRLLYTIKRNVQFTIRVIYGIVTHGDDGVWYADLNKFYRVIVCHHVWYVVLDQRFIVGVLV
jgi:hypothetical protein